ncbi:MAG: glycosyltransferase [Bacteroidetes bacterium]|nr:glycosyltransferase [Bacteroidota bacterium]
MKTLREVTVFTNGDSTKLSTWSNVPYLFTQTLIEKGIKVNRVDLTPDASLKNFWDKTMGRVARKLNKQTNFEYFRSRLHFMNVSSRIKKAIHAHRQTDIFIFLTFSFSASKLTKKPVVLFGDWTYDYYFQYYENRKPDLLEQQSIHRENSGIEIADLVLPLFPGIAAHMKKTYSNKNIHYLGNVINSVNTISEAEALKAKENSNELLFVGGPKYLAGALSLITAFGNLKKQNPLLKLHIVGMKEADIGITLPTDVICYGYIDKGNDKERELYYDLFKRAKAFINTTPKWGAFSATIEAMYFYNPVIVMPYDEFVETFGKQIPFGVYCHENTAEAIEKSIRTVFEHTDYNSVCIQANNAVKDYSWSAYIDKMIRLINALPKGD